MCATLQHSLVIVAFVWVILTIQVNCKCRHTCTGDPLSSGPQITIKPTSQSAQPGHNVTFQCEAYFGCEGEGDGSVDWNVYEALNFSGNIVIVPGELPNSRYLVEKYCRDNGTKQGANLTIIDVQEEDYNVTGIHCRLTTAQIATSPDWQSRFNVTLLRSKKIEVVNSSLEKILIPVSCAIVVGLLLAIVIWYRFAPRIGFFFYSHMGKIEPNTKYKTDLTVIHDTDDADARAFVINHVYPKLIDNLGYSTFIEGLDMLSGPEFSQSREAVFDSFSIMFIVTPDIVDEARYSHLLRLAVNLHRSIILVEVPKDDKPALVEVHKDDKPALDSELKRSKITDQDSILRDGLKFLTNVKWPGENSSNRKLDKFWYQIRKKLPKLDAKTETAYISREKSDLMLESTLGSVSTEPRETVTQSDREIDLIPVVPGKHPYGDIRINPYQPLNSDEPGSTMIECDTVSLTNDPLHPGFQGYNTINTIASCNEKEEIPTHPIHVPKKQLSVDSGYGGSLDTSSPTSNSFKFINPLVRLGSKLSTEPIQEQDIV